MTEMVREESQQGKEPKLGLTHEYVGKTAERLVERIHSRFGDDDLTNIARQVLDVATMSERRIARALRVGFFIRLLTWPVVIAVGIGIAAWIKSLHLAIQVNDAGDLAQSLDSVLQLMLVVGAGGWFLLSIGTKVQRRSLFKALQELHALAQIIDLVQLDKDPDRLHFSSEQRTAKSPTLGKANTAFLLSRYLDYCSELLSVLGKISCLYRERVSDEAVLSRLGDFERLANQLRSSIGSKMVLITHSQSK
jgi:hypothetical protein